MNKSQISNCEIIKGTFLLPPDPKNVITCTDLIKILYETLISNATISEISNLFSNFQIYFHF